MARDYSKYNPAVDYAIVQNHRELAKSKIGLDLGNVSDEEIYKIVHANGPFETHDHDEFMFLREVAEKYGDETHPWFTDNDPWETDEAREIRKTQEDENA